MPIRSQYKETIVNARARRGHRTITDAISAARTAGANSSIRVRAGVYREALIIRDTLFNIEIIGDGAPGAVIIEGGISCNTRENVIIHNLTFKPPDAESYPGGGVIDCAAGEMAAGLVIAYDCAITNPIGVGVLVSGNGAELELYRCTIDNCRSDGLRVEDYGSLKLADCRVFQNKRYGIDCQDNSKLYLHDCEISANGKEGILITPLGYAYLTGCRGWDNGGAGAWLFTADARVLGENNQPPLPAVNSSTGHPPDRPLQTSWQKRGTSFYIKIDDNFIWIGPTYRSNAYHCTLSEFYRGNCNEIVRDNFGHKILNEVLAVVTALLNNQKGAK